MSNEERLDEILSEAVFHPSDIEMDIERRKHAKAELTKLIDEDRQQLIQRIKEVVIANDFFKICNGCSCDAIGEINQILETMEKNN